MSATTWEEAAQEVANDLIEGVETDARDIDSEVPQWSDVLSDFQLFTGDRDRAYDVTDEEVFSSIAFCTVRMVCDDRGFEPWVYVGGIVETIARKQHDYGHENIAKFGVEGLKVRLWDKLARYDNLQKRMETARRALGDESDIDAGALNESIDDTLTDIVGYCIIGMMWERGIFLLPLAADVKPRLAAAMQTVSLAQPDLEFFRHGAANEPPWPPPLIERWLAHDLVPSDLLARELRAWAEHIDPEQKAQRSAGQFG